jgi:lipopolysaccharide exporter
MTSLRKSAVSGVKWTTVSTAAISVLSLVQLTVLARLLKPSDFGLMAMTMVVIGFAQAYADMGVSAAVVHRQDTTREQLSSLYWLNIFAGVVLFFLVWAASPLAVIFFHEPLLYKLLPVVALSFLISSIAMQFHWLLEKDLKFNVLAKMEIFASTVGTIVAVVSAFLGQGVWSLVWGQLAASTAKTILLLRACWVRWSPLVHFRREDLRGYLSFGLYQMGERSINYFNSRIDQLLVGNLLGAKELGYYTFAFNLIILPVNNINPILTRVAFPVFARMQDDIPGLRQSYLKMVNLLSTMNAPLLFGLAAVAPLFIPLFFGPQWVPAILLVQILTFYGFLRSINNPVGSLLLAKGRADFGFRWNFVMLFVMAPSVFVGAQLGGAKGIAMALVVLMLCNSAASYVFLVKNLIGSCARSYAASIIRPVMLSAIMACCVGLTSLSGLKSFAWLATEIVVGGIIYLILLWFFDRSTITEVKNTFLRAEA